MNTFENSKISETQDFTKAPSALGKFSEEYAESQSKCMGGRPGDKCGGGSASQLPEKDPTAGKLDKLNPGEKKDEAQIILKKKLEALDGMKKEGALGHGIKEVEKTGVLGKGKDGGSKDDSDIQPIKGGKDGSAEGLPDKKSVEGKQLDDAAIKLKMQQALINEVSKDSGEKIDQSKIKSGVIEFDNSIYRKQ